MKKILKTLTLGASILPVVSLVTFSASCSNNKFNQIAHEFKQQIIDKFTELSKYYRPTFHTKKVCDYIYDWAEQHHYDHLEKRLYDPDEEYYADDNGYNIRVVIPASAGGENIPTVILQGHTDMVVKCDKEKEPEVEQNGIVPQIEGNIMHSKDYETSLGADNGIGIATMMVLAENQDKFKHGVIKLFFTTDEEDGPSGAARCPSEWINYDPANPEGHIKYLINLDSESYNEIGIGCAGCIQSRIYINLTEANGGLTPIAANENKFTIKIDGLIGGHSGTTIHQHKINSIKLMSYLYDDLYRKLEDQNDTLRFISAYEGDDEEADNNPGNIPDQLSFSIATTLSSDKVLQSINDVKQQQLSDHPTEAKLNISIENYLSTYTNALTTEYSRKIARYAKLIPYGPISYNEWGVKTSSNINTFRIRDKKFCGPDKIEAGKDGTVYVEYMGRSSSQIELDQLESHYGQMIEQSFGVDANVYPKFKSSLEPWNIDKDEQLPQLVYKNGKDYGIDMKFVKHHWWLEISAFTSKEMVKDLNMVSIGISIDNPHSKQETIHLDTIEPCLKVILSTLESLK